jgi:hypothetical protein
MMAINYGWRLPVAKYADQRDAEIAKTGAADSEKS